LRDKRGFIFIKGLWILAAAQQNVFPLLNLDFKLYLRVTRGINHLLYLRFLLHNLFVLLKRFFIDGQSTQANKKRSKQQNGGQQT